MKEDRMQSLSRIIDKSQLITDPAELIPYEIDATQERASPDAVVFPHSSEEVVRIVKWAAAEGMPLVARGAGTGLSGGSVAEKGGIIVEFSQMARVLEFDTSGRSVIVEPGLVNLTLDGLVKAKGLYYPPDPASGRSATIGGNIAENAGGPHCFKYGVTTNYITGLEIVLGDGRAVRLGGRAFDYPEYDMIGLINGSEGTLGIITKVYARLLRNPPGVKTMVCAFDSVGQAGKAVSAVIASGMLPATMEMMDQNIMCIVEDVIHAGLPIHKAALLIIEVDGFQPALDPQMDEIAHILEQNGAQEMKIARDAAERDKLWYGRKSAAGAMARLAPAYFLVDGTVPRSRLADTLDAVNHICSHLDLKVGYVFHAGDGNLHPFIPFFPSDQAQVARGWQACEEIMREVVKREGTITGEHGVGIEKREFMLFMYDGAELSAMHEVKEVFDPENMMNPGKVFPAQLPEVKQVAPAKTTPEGMFVPATPEEAAAGLAALSAAKRSAYINTTRVGAVTISTRALCGIKRYEPDDLYITVGAGMTLAELQAFLGKEGRQVPLAAPWAATTIGGIVGSNLNSPQRMRYGAVRDLMLCCTVALPDGRLIGAGRALVKNVAGYDMPKLFVGSHGTLGLITDVTLKLMPLPRATRTLLVPVDDLRRGLGFGGLLLPIALVASALVLCKGEGVQSISTPYLLAYTAEGMPEEVETELAQVREALHQAGAPEPVEVKSPTGTELWATTLGKVAADAMQVRVGVAPKDLVKFVQDQASALELGTFLADIANGLVYAVNTPENATSAQAWLNVLRQASVGAGGYAVATHLPHKLEGEVAKWGYQPQALDLMRMLKARYDPAGILGSGVFVVDTP